MKKRAIWIKKPLFAILGAAFLIQASTAVALGAEDVFTVTLTGPEKIMAIGEKFSIEPVFSNNPG
ncbi:MAG: hypothetical protein LBT44_03295, partial [Clostridiales bacterium]|nr:hypothetical protein [Clostridiales bacterium]